MTREKLICIGCASNYAVSSFYSHRNPLIHESFGICKKCVKKNVDENRIETLHDYLRTANIPYLKDYWKKAFDGDTDTIGTYLKNLNSLSQNKELVYANSDDTTSKSSQVESIVNEEDFEVTKAIVKRWGRNYELEDYITLEEIFENFGGYETEDNIQLNLIINICKTQLVANRALEDGDHTKYEKMMNVLSKLMGDANIKPVQIKANAQEGAKMSSWGEWVQLIEEKEPIDELDSSFKDKGFVRKYLDLFFFTQVKRVFGRATDEEVERLNKAVDGKLE